MRHALIVLLAAATLFGGTLAHAQGFKFSDEDTSDQQEEAETQARVQAILASPCRSKIKNQKVMVLIGESRNGYIQAAQAEIDAYFKNDPDAALSASKRLSAQYVLRGLISTETAYNRIVRVNQVNIRMNFTLTDAGGRTVAQATAENASYAGMDTSGMALTLINEKADEVVAQLYSDYCRLGR